MPHQFLQLPPNPGLRPPFFPMNPMFRFGSPPNQHPPMPPPPPVGTPLPNLDPSSNRQPHSILGLPVPPVTILVPCPIVIPLPIPIPIPIPLIDFLKATIPKPPKEEPSVSQSPDHHPIESQLIETRGDMSDPDQEPDPDECPLDFTIVSHEQRRQQEQELMDNVQRGSYSLEAVAVSGDPKPERSPEHKLPKFKITRLNLRRIEEVQQEEAVADGRAGGKVKEQRSPEEEEADHCREMVERSRPLRKRKRVVGHHEEVAVREEDSGGAKG